MFSRSRTIAYVCNACQSRSLRTRVSGATRTTSKASPKSPKARLPGSRSDKAREDLNRTRNDLKVENNGTPRPSDDPTYKPAQSWQQLERIGSPQWLERTRDNKPSFTGFARKKAGPVAASEIDACLRDIAKSIDAHTATTFEKSSNASDRAWLDVQITAPGVKLEIAKQILKTTGIRVPDCTLLEAQKMKNLRSALLDIQRPKEITQQLAGVKAFEGLANVRLHSRRVTAIDREKQVGRWKMIEKELRERGLPVTGHTTRVKSTIMLNNV